MDEIEAEVAESLAILSTPLGNEDEEDQDFFTVEGTNGEWKTTFVDETMFKENVNFSIFCKTRTETPKTSVNQKKNFFNTKVPNRMYSSLKYEILLKLDNSMFKEKPLPFIVCKISTIDPTTKQQIFKNNHPVIKGKKKILTQIRNCRWCVKCSGI
jgi:hypothetical protein